MHNGELGSRLSALESKHEALSEIVNEDENRLDQLQAKIIKVRELSVLPFETNDILPEKFEMIYGNSSEVPS